MHNKREVFNIHLLLIVTMRATISFLLMAFILVPVVSVATDSKNIETWENARYKQDAGTVGGASVSLSNDSSGDNIMMNIEDFPTIVETYTATWCENCVMVEQTRDQAIGNNSATIIHYHRHYYETEDPFGDNSTENRWELNYGTSSTNILGASRLAPTTVIDGERMHPGHRPKSNTLKNDFTTSISVGSTAPLYGNISLSFIKNNANGNVENSSLFSWSTSNLIFNCVDDCTNTVSTTAWLLFVEDVAYFPEGSNDLEYYHHVLHHVILLDGLDGSMEYTYPSTWDGDDMTAILIVDWLEEENEDNFFPGPSMILTIFCFLISSLVYSKNK
tara:strand:+ start:2086 stop:3081 length:996 start_codon:yes stop_codon:yes gene_type:complete